MPNIHQVNMEEIAINISQIEGIPSCQIRWVKGKIKHENIDRESTISNFYPNFEESRTLYYENIEMDQEISEKELSKIISKDDLDPKHEHAVHTFFPFASSESETFKVPNWTKSLLYQYYSLKNVKKMIKYFNTKGCCVNSNHRMYLPLQGKINSLIIDDIDLQQLTEF